MKTLILALAILLLITTSAFSAIPRGFENYDTWKRLPCVDMDLGGGIVVHIHHFVRDGIMAAEIFKPPYSIGQEPTLYAFDTDGNGQFDVGETHTPAEIERER